MVPAVFHLVAAFALLWLAVPLASDRTAADVYVSVNKASQRMTVMVDGKPRYNWAISSGLNGGPPSGTFRPQRLERMWHSRTYDWSPMPHSIFFHHGFAIHGTNYVSRLGRPASHGCVRLHPSNAAHAVRAGEGAWNGPHHHCDLGFLAPDGVSLILCTSFRARDFTSALAAGILWPMIFSGWGLMLGRASAVAVAACLMAASVYDRAAAAEVVISINKAAQSMSVLIDGVATYNWVVSTGVGGGPHDGTYKPGRLERHWASRKYGMAPMPYSIFFDGNYAIHGTVKVAQLGRRASKGCVRLHPRDAAVLFALVGREKANTTIVVDKATHVAARAMVVKSDAPVEAKAAPAVEAPKPQLAKADAIVRDESAVAPIRKRASRKKSPRTTRRGLPFGMKYGAAQ